MEASKRLLDMREAMELSESQTGAGLRIEPEEVDMAAAVFLSVHHDCGEAARIHPGKERLVCHCDSCGVSRAYTYEVEGTQSTSP